MKDIKTLYFDENRNNDGSLNSAKGSFIISGSRMNVTVRETNIGDYSHRGRIVVKDATGKNLKVTKLDLKSKDANKSEMKICDLCSQFYLIASQTEHNKLIEIIEKKLGEMLVKNAGKIISNSSAKYNPNNIVPAVAYDKLGKTFIKKESKNSKNPEKAIINKDRELRNAIECLPNRPMINITGSMISTRMRGFERASFSLLSKFWQSCIDAGIINGENPVKIPPINKRDKKKRARAKMSEYSELTLEEQKLLMQDLEIEPNGYKLGIILTLGTGGSTEEVLSLTWSNISFGILGKYVADDFAILKRHYRRKNCPIENGSIVITPWAALILRHRYNELISKYSKKRVDKMKIVCKMDNPTVALSKTTYQKDAKSFVRKFLREKSKNFVDISKLLTENEAMTVTNATKILQNTYESNVRKRLNFVNNPEKVEFLLGTIKYYDSSSLNYIAFTTPEAYLGYYRAMKVLAKPKKIDKPIETFGYREDGCYITTPKSNVDYCSQEVVVTLLPGEEIEVFSDGGVSCSLEATST